MSDYSFYLHPLSVVKTLFWGSIFASAASIVTDRWLHKCIKRHWKLLLVLFLLVLSWRLPMDGIFFHGLEYEDSYVYAVAGRQMLENAGPSQTTTGFPYSINVCDVGNLKSCQDWQLFPEHFIGYPYTISLLSRLIGYSPNVASIENVIAASLTDLLIFLIALLTTSDIMIASAAAIVYAITPVFAVYGLETSAEPVSNACLSLIIWFCVRSVSALGTSGYRWQMWLRWCGLTAILLFSLTVKREDILLAVILPFVLPLISTWRAVPRFERIKLLLLFVLSAALALALCVHMRLLQTMEGEAALLRTYPLTMERIATFVYGFARSFFVNQWYGGAVAAVAIGVVVSCRRRGLLLVPLVVFIAFGLLYAFHVRSYYEMRSGHIETMAALRFSMNLMTVWALLAGTGIGAVMTKVVGLSLYRRHKHLSFVMGAIILAAVFITSFTATINLRDDTVEDEANVRLTPARTALQFISRKGPQSDYIVTLEPLIVQMYAQPTTRVVGLENVTSTTLEKLMVSGAARRFIYLDESIYETDADFERYGEQTQYLHSLPQSIVYDAEGFRVSVIDIP